MLHLRDARLVDWRSLEIRRGDFRVESGHGDGGGVPAVGTVPAGAEVLDCGGGFVTRSFAIAHHHVYSMLARGMPPPAVPPRSFREILESVWWKLDRALDTEMIRASARSCAVEALRCGTTFVIDHHASPNAAGGSLFAIAEALDEVGVGHVLCYELSDRDGEERLEEGLRETDDYLRARQGLVGLHASFTVSDALLERAVALAAEHGTGIHVHVAEDLCDQEHCLREHGVRVVERLRRAGCLLPKSLLAHCIHVDDQEREVLRASPAFVVENRESNQHNGVGAFDARGLGDRILIGTDGMHSDSLRSGRAAFLSGGIGPLDAYRRLRRVHDYLCEGGFAGDGEADLVVLDYDPPTAVHSDNWPAHLMYGVSRAHVRHVVKSGEVVVENGRVRTVDEERVMAQAREQAERLWRRL